MSEIFTILGNIVAKKDSVNKKAITSFLQNAVGKDSKEFMEKGVQDLLPEEAETFSSLINKGKRTHIENLELKNLELKVFDKINYQGEKHSIGEIVSPEGNIDEQAFKKICQELITGTPGLTDLAKIESKNPRHIKAGTKKAVDHSIAVAHSMQQFGITSEYTKQEAVAAALLHDLGKMVSTGEFIHGPLGAKLLKQLFPDISENTLTAVSRHMEKFLKKDNSLTKMLHIADLANGQTDLSKVKDVYSKIQVPSSTLYVPIVHTKSYNKATKKWQESTEKFETTARHEKVIPRNTIAGARYEYITDPTGTYNYFAHIDAEGNPLITLQDGQLKRYEEALSENRINIEKASQQLENPKKIAGIPVYQGNLISRQAKIHLNSPEIQELTNIYKKYSTNNNITPRERELLHVYYNLKWAATHPEELGQMSILGGKTKGKSSVKGFSRLSPGQISTIVDLYKKENYQGIVSPVLKGSDNLVSRNTDGYIPGGVMSAGNKLWTTNSPLVALRFADIRAFKNKETWEQLIAGLSKEDAKKATEIKDDILAFCKKHNIKQGDFELKTFSKTKYREGTSENIRPELYQNPEVLGELLKKYEKLQHLLGDAFLGIGGVRRGVVKINPKSLVPIDYNAKRYSGWMPKDSYYIDYFNRKYQDHNGIADFVDQHRFQQLITANIGETLPEALKRGAPYGADIVVPIKDFIVSKWRHGGNIQYFK